MKFDCGLFYLSTTKEDNETFINEQTVTLRDL
jgi:hypothetical protein